MRLSLPVVCGRSCPCGCLNTHDLLAHRGMVLYREGEPATQVYFVRRGTVILTRKDATGEDRARAVRKDGGFVGLEALATGTYGDTATVMVTSMLCAVEREAFLGWLGEPGAPVRVAMMQLLDEAGKAPAQAAAQATGATERVARWIVTRTADGERHVPRRHVASLLGMVPETLSRALARLASEGLITVNRRGVTVLDLATLRARAGVGEAEPIESSERAQAVTAPAGDDTDQGYAEE